MKDIQEGRQLLYSQGTERPEHGGVVGGWSMLNQARKGGQRATLCKVLQALWNVWGSEKLLKL